MPKQRTNYGVAKNLRPINGKPRRTIGQRELDLSTIAQLYIRGLPQSKIAEQLSAMRDYTVTLKHVSNDLAVIRTRWLDTYIKDFNDHQAKELAHIDELERAYWEEFERSRQPKVDAFAEKTEDVHTYSKDSGAAGASIPAYTRTKTRTRKTERDGNSAYLAGIERCIEMRAKILGLFAPTKIDVSWRKQAKAAGVDPEKIIDGLVKNIVESGGQMPPILLNPNSARINQNQPDILDKENKENQDDY